ncbi:MAG: YidC/Oxa1 family insertase periplasmic-domain containing protein [Phycisphaerales bacterium]|nr:MAG: YidC/Oxa1 family insertase periplasmic-domain containing protein [Phycisphaerales bacterium]
MRIALTLVVTAFVLFCGWLVIESGLFEHSSQIGRGLILLQQEAANEQPQADSVPELAPVPAQLRAAPNVSFGADNAEAATVVLGSVDPKSGFKYRLELTSKGAAIRTATFSEYDDRDHKDPQPLEVISPIPQSDGSEILTMANAQLVFVEHQLQLPLDRLDWKSSPVETADDGGQIVRFEAIIKVQGTNEAVLKLAKTYKVRWDSYLLDCDITIENVSDAEQKVRFNLVGPSGLDREGFRSDMRKVVAGFRNKKTREIGPVSLDRRRLIKADSPDKRQLSQPGGNLLWVAAVNKYFAAIAVPVSEAGKDYCDWMPGRAGRFYNPDGDVKADSGDETVGLELGIATSTLAAEASKTYRFQLYIGPKDKSLFDKNERYRELGLIHTISFMPCMCCPAWMINPLAFGILALMKLMYGLVPNYGVVIIILVFLMRLVMHPVTKKSQVSMSKMSTLAPKVEEIKKKYANNKAEMNKQMMALYREQGASPIMGMLPMMVQMPIWIALWSAVYASVDLRGAAFLPFWITDLSAPDALFRFPAVTLPLFGKLDSFNLLPILMGVAFYLQQRLMPSQANAAANPQMAQQQKMMKIMLPLMFPLMLYKGPSGVNLYIMASTFAGVIEQHVIRKHIREKEEAESEGLVSATSKTGGKVKKKKPKPFFKT